MGRHPDITDELAKWISAQRIFFVATAPLSPEAHINCSPKGGDSFRVLGPLEVVYHDYTGSGIETAAHVRENQRITIMFCAFQGPPRIVRLYGRGTVVGPDDPRFAAYNALLPPNAGTRAFIHVALTRVADSCGYAVPFFEYRGERDALDKWAKAKSPEQLDAYRAAKNRESIDGLPGV
jgi:hypothetical protein